MNMTDQELDQVANGSRPFTNDERTEAEQQFEFLSEYTWSENANELTDKDLAEELQSASLDYCRCTGLI